MAGVKLYYAKFHPIRRSDKLESLKESISLYEDRIKAVNSINNLELHSLRARLDDPGRVPNKRGWRGGGHIRVARADEFPEHVRPVGHGDAPVAKGLLEVQLPTAVRVSTSITIGTV